jgi:hypothetical protein
LDNLSKVQDKNGIAADDKGTIYAADIGAHNLRKYVKLK